jgi:isoleucyl-tRNA synthetase
MDSPVEDLKKTVNLPRTDFPMKANLPTSEPKLLDRWEREGLYEKIRQAAQGRPTYILHDGPPYANGNIHMGTAFNKTLKDFIVKSKSMAGFDAPFVPGWDCHGLPIEFKVDSELGAKKAKMTTAQIRAACRRYAEKFVEIHRREFKRLGVFGRWDDPYLTMSAQYESVIARAFVDFLDSGYVYKGLKPVNWCLSCKTALAEAEVEYEDHSSPSIWVRFALTSDAAAIDPALAGRAVFGLIWTTTPWTIPANVALAFHPRFDYAAVEVRGEVYLLAEGLLAATAGNCGWPEHQILARFKGDRLDGATFAHPIIERESLGVLADYVTLEQGTGVVHTAPGHGQEDYLTGQRYGLPTYCPVDASGQFFQADGAPGRIPDSLLGLTVWDANPVVVNLLREAGALCGHKTLAHSYPHCWRCHNATIFRATEQWFIGMDQNGRSAQTLRQDALDAIRRINWHPEWGEERISNMIAGRPDWCISRQRVWGVPITVFYCEECGEPLTDRRHLDHIVDQFAEHTADVWYTKSAAELLGPEVRCSKCGGGQFRKESDILDVWFDSGSSHLAVLCERFNLPWPADLYIEGGDQYRGWFHSSLLVGVGLHGGAPYRNCATHGWTLDADGRAMSKSLGNIIEPQEIVKKYGADLLRLWVASVEFTEDVRISEVILTRLSEAYRKLRNTFRYALGNLHDFDPVRDAQPASELPELDQWILRRAAQLVEECRGHYERFAFHRVYQAIYSFAVTDLSSVYFDILKDRLYFSAANWPGRRAAQTVLYSINYVLVRLIAPLLAFTAEEVWTHMRRPDGAPESVHLALFPESSELLHGLEGTGGELMANWEGLLDVRTQVLKSLETARNEKLIGSPLEAHVCLEAGPALWPLLDSYLAELPTIFIVSQVDLKAAAEGVELAVTVERAGGEKCDRCWKYTYDRGADARWPGICARCAAAVQDMVGA